MAHQSIILELTTEKKPVLTVQIEENWAVARDFHHTMREVIERRGSTVLYCALLNMDVDPKCGGCGNK